MKNHFILLIAFFALCSCEKIDNEPETGGPDPVEDPTLWLWPGQDTLLRLEGDPAAYTVSSENEDVASVESHEEGWTIKAGQPGVTRVHFDGGTNRSLILEVRSSMIAGDWESIPSDENYQNSILIEADEAAFAEELQTELEEETARLLGFKFSPYFNASTGEVDSAIFAKFNHGTPPELMLRGDYLLGELILTLSAPDERQEEVYRLRPYPDHNVLGLQRDMTAHYQELHPDKGIQKVVILLHLRYRLPPG